MTKIVPFLCITALLACAGTAAAQGPIAAGQTVTGALAQDDQAQSDGSRFDAWTYSGKRGERLTITLKSTAFDAYLTLGRGDGGAFKEMKTDDDGGGGSDSQIVVVLPADGEYVIRAGSLVGDSYGEYTLRVVSRA